MAKQNAVEIKKLSLKIGGKIILDTIDLEIQKGEAVVIAGRNGSGKTTLLKCLAGVLFPDKGSISYHKGLNRREIGFISDKVSLFEKYSIKQGIRFHKDVYKIDNFDHTLINELNLDMDQKIKDLSAGERILFHLSLILSQKPEVLLVDEIIHAADPYIREKFLEAVIDLLENHKTTLIMVNHTFAEIEKIPERILIMEKGRFIADEKSEVLGQKLKKIITETKIPEEVPCLFKRELTHLGEYYIYPFQEKLREKFPYDYKNVSLNEIIKAFIGGQYAQKRNQ